MKQDALASVVQINDAEIKRLRKLLKLNTVDKNKISEYLSKEKEKSRLLVKENI